MSIGTERHAYSTVQVRDMTGASYRQLDYWSRVGYLRPSVNGPNVINRPGSGYYRSFDDAEVACARFLVRVLVRARIDSDALRCALDHIRSDGLTGVVPLDSEGIVLADLDAIVRLAND